MCVCVCVLERRSVQFGVLGPLLCPDLLQCQSLQKQLLSSVNRCARLELEMEEAKGRVAQVEVSAM